MSDYAALWYDLLRVVILWPHITPSMIERLYPDRRIDLNGAYPEYETSLKYYSEN